MSHFYARWALIALFLLSSTALASTIEIPYNDKRVVYTPADGWSLWTYNETVPCPGTWAPSSETLNYSISLSFQGTGVTVYGYSDGVAPWLYQLDDGSHEALTVLPGKPCRVIKDSQGLKDGKHQVVVTPQSSSFVLTKFTVETGGLLPNSTGTNSTGTNTTHSSGTHLFGSGAFSLDGGKQVARVLLFVLPACFFIALLGL